LLSSSGLSALAVAIHDKRVCLGDIRERQVTVNFKEERVIQAPRPCNTVPPPLQRRNTGRPAFAGIEVHFCPGSVRITQYDEVLARLPKAEDFVARLFLAPIEERPRRPRDSLAECAGFGLSISWHLDLGGKGLLFN